MKVEGARTNPYVGLKPFEVSDSLFFFGRREQIVQLLELLHRTHFLGLVGTSGCGKSSLVRAGLIPALLAGFLVQDRDCWRVSVMKPGHSPLGNLARSLLGDSPADAEVNAFAQRIAEQQTAAIVSQLEGVLGERTNQLLLVDQFEELFAFRDDGHDAHPDARSATRERRREEADDFVNLLLSLLGETHLPIYVVVTMRSDFLGDCDVFPGLPEAMNASRYLVPRLAREQLAEAIEGPAKLKGSTIQPRLLDRLLNEVGDRSDQLPVLQHALMRTWKAWEKRGARGPLAQEDYESVGTLAHALEIHADEAIKNVDATLASKLFRALTDTDPQGRRVRRATSLSELERLSGASEGEVLGTIEEFVSDERFFIVTEPASAGNERRVDISHESLIRQWPRLSKWVDEEREARDRLLYLGKRSSDWAQKRGELLTGIELTSTGEWWGQGGPKQWASRYLASQEVAEIGAFLAASRRYRARTKVLGLLLGLLVVASLVVMVWQRAQTQRALLLQAQIEAARAKMEAQVALAVADREQLTNQMNELRSNLANAKDEATRARLEAELEKATRDHDKAAKAAVQAGSALSRTEAKACSCAPGDPLCSCL